MAWNKNTYYFQNQMKVLSGSDPEKGYKEDDPIVLEQQEREDRIRDNGLYRFVSLIKAKFDALKKAIRGSWRLHDEENVVSDDLDNCTTVGNYKPSEEENVSIAHKPITRNIPFTLKVSQVGPDRQYGDLWQDFILEESGHRWYRRGSWNDTENKYNWGPWMLILTSKEPTPLSEDSNYPDKDNGTADDIFLRKKNDYTTGPIGFGKDPNTNVDESTSLHARIVFGDYSYGTDLPSVHFAGINETSFSKGQIYLQYDDGTSEG